MAYHYRYIAVQSLAFNGSQRGVFFAALQALETLDCGFAHYKNHWVVSGNQMIIEGRFNDDDLVPVALLNLAASVLGVAAESVTCSESTARKGWHLRTEYSLSSGGTDYVTVAMLGGKDTDAAAKRDAMHDHQRRAWYAPQSEIESIVGETI